MAKKKTSKKTIVKKVVKPKRVLSIDGGGIRGIIAGQVLVALETELQNKLKDKNVRLADYFDLIAGTSTGGILAVCLLASDVNGRPRFTAREVAELYTENGDEIFDVSIWQAIASAGGMIDEKYDADVLEEVLNNYLGDLKLSDLLKPSLITAYNIRKRETHFFKQHEATNPARNFYARDLCRATSAAPTYFEVSRIKSFTNVWYPLVDGGVFANNPSLCAYAEVRSYFGVGASDIVLVSIGTGNREKSYSYSKAKDWGPTGWAKPVIDIMMSGVAETVDYQLQQIFESVKAKDQYHRFQIELPTWVSSDMDNADIENMNKLVEVGEELVNHNKAKIKKIVNQIV